MQHITVRTPGMYASHCLFKTCFFVGWQSNNVPAALSLMKWWNLPAILNYRSPPALQIKPRLSQNKTPRESKTRPASTPEHVKLRNVKRFLIWFIHELVVLAFYLHIHFQKYSLCLQMFHQHTCNYEKFYIIYASVQLQSTSLCSVLSPDWTRFPARRSYLKDSSLMSKHFIFTPFKR